MARDKLNLIVILCDTFRRDHAGCYGAKRVRTPCLDRLAAESVIFDNAHAGSFPTLPCRAELFSGKFVFPFLRWGPFPAGHATLAEQLGEARYQTALVFDNLPMGRRGYGYDRGFQTRIHLRGQWYDEWVEHPREMPLPVPEDRLGEVPRVRQYLRNVAGRRREEDYFAPRVFSAAIEWLERFASQGPFFLHVDCFDPHEPWDPPPQYVDPDVVAESWILYPRFGRTDTYSAQELEAIRELYAGEVRLVDRWLGKFLEAVDALGLRENTALVFLSDHGILLGEHGLVGKSGKRQLDVEGWPPYREVARIPLVVRLPGLAPRREPAFVHPGDLMPTLLELAGARVPGGVTTTSLLPLLRGEAEAVREIAVTAWSYRGWRAHHPTCVRDEDWTLVWWRTGIRPRLYHLASDPGETRDVYSKYPQEARRLHARYVEFLKRQPCRPRNYWSRRFFFGGAAP